MVLSKALYCYVLSCRLKMNFLILSYLILSYLILSYLILSVVSHHIRACFSTDGVCCGLVRLHVIFGGSGGIMTTARPGLPYPCSPQAKTRDESSRRGAVM